MRTQVSKKELPVAWKTNSHPQLFHHLEVGNWYYASKGPIFIGILQWHDLARTLF